MSARTKPGTGQAQPVRAAGEHRPVSRYALVAAAVASLGGLLFGYDTGVISGAELYLTRSFRLTSFTEELTVSAVLIGAILGAAVAGWLADTLGRRITLIMQAAIFAVGALLTAVSPNLACLVGCRILVGLGIGAASVVAPMYTAEMAHPRLRGRLVFLFQLCLTIGIAVADWVDLAFSNAGKGMHEQGWQQ